MKNNLETIIGTISRAFLVFVTIIFTNLAFLAAGGEVLAFDGKVIVDVPPEVTDGMPPETRKNLDSIIQYLKTRIGGLAKKIESVPIDIPSSAMPPNVEVIKIDEVWPPKSDLPAPNPDAGKPLTPEQMRSIRTTSLFKVPAGDGKFAVWQVNMWFRGSDTVYISWRQGQDRSNLILDVELPEALYSDGTYGDNLLQYEIGKKNFKKAATELFGILVGLREVMPVYSAAQIDKMITNLRQEAVREAAKAAGQVAPEDKLDDAVLTRVKNIEDEARQQWYQQQKPVAQRLIAEGKQKNLHDNELFNFVRNSGTRYAQEILFTILEKDPELEKIKPGMGGKLARQGRALRILAEAEAEFSTRVTSQRQVVIAEATKNRQQGYSSWSPENWNQTEINNRADTFATQYYRDNVWAFYTETINKIRTDGFPEEADRIAQQVHWLKTNLATEVEKLQKFEKPAGQIQFNNTAWFSNNWKVEVGGNGYANIEKTYPSVVKTKKTGWRFSLLWNRMYNHANEVLHAFWSDWMWNGPVGLRSWNSDPFPSSYKVAKNQDGSIRTDDKNRPVFEGTDLQSTIWSRVGDIRKEGADEMERFEADKELSGLLGEWEKPVERPFAYLWDITGKRYVAPFLMVGAQAVATFISGVVTLGATVTTPLWAPATSTLVSLKDALFYDSLGSTGYASEWEYGKYISNDWKEFALFKQLGFAIGGAGEAILSAPWHGLRHAANNTFDGARWLASSAWYGAGRGICSSWDYVVYHTLITLDPRVPYAEREWLISKWFGYTQVSGPGVDQKHFFRINSGLALYVYLSSLEKIELEEASGRIQKAILAPYEQAIETVKPIYELLGLSGDEKSPFLSAADEARRVQLGKLNKTVYARQRTLSESLPRAVYYSSTFNLIKMTEDQLQETLSKATALSEQVLSAYVLADAKDAAKFWKRYKIDENDQNRFQKFATRQLAEVFGQPVLVPFGGDDTNYIIDVRNPSLEEIALGIANGRLPVNYVHVNVPVNPAAQEEQNVDRREDPDSYRGEFDAPSINTFKLNQPNWLIDPPKPPKMGDHER
ncbi:MAG: hypothetical protein C5B49_07580 [Bdellovibrio sp.]|nr:MAG: hypothetical protein C5B49_07580 [Bdellovibrio sp.]